MSQYGAGVTIGDAAAGGAVQAAWWREQRAGRRARLGDVTPFNAEVDFAKLAAGTDDDSGVPKTGPINRILASRHLSGRAIDPAVCFDLAGGLGAGAKCDGPLRRPAPALRALRAATAAAGAAATA